MPVKAPARVVWDEGAGAGRREAVARRRWLVGLYVPVGTSPVGTGPRRGSANVRVALWPNGESRGRVADVGQHHEVLHRSGATSNASTSFSAEWVRLLKVTVTLVTAPAMPGR